MGRQFFAINSVPEPWDWEFRSWSTLFSYSSV